MSKVLDFINECGPFFVLTVKENAPIGRPFGAIMEDDDHLYISTSNLKEVYKQMKENPNIAIIALKPGTRLWMRLSAKAFETFDLAIKAKMLEVCPQIQKHYHSADDCIYAVFKLEVDNVEFY